MVRIFVYIGLVDFTDKLKYRIKVSPVCMALSPLLVIVSPENTDVTEATDGSGIAREG